MKARVFVSCGQNKDSDEPQIADNVAKVLDELGFDPYVAVRERTLRGVIQNIFSRLAESEYFLLIDFKRDLLASSDEHRGSPFCHQELALATYLEKRVLVFQEQGVRKFDGIIQFLQANAIPFTNRFDVLMFVRKAVLEEKWNANWRDELTLSRLTDQHADELHPQGPVRYWHIAATNNNPYKTAFGCYAYLRSLVRVYPNPETISFEVVENKWRGISFLSAIIPPKKSREFDAFMLYANAPRRLIGGTHTDSPRHQLVVFEPGNYLLCYSVYSETFAEAKNFFTLEFPGTSVEGVVFREATRDELEVASEGS
jgi:hypothetical protein